MNEASRRVSLALRWERARAALAPMVWDAALAVYIALGVLYMMYHDDRSGEPEGATLMAVVVALLVAIEVAVLVNALLDGAGPRITKLTLVRADGRPATSWDRLRRVAVLHLVGLIVLQVAGIVGGLLVTYTAAGEWFGSLMGLARVGVIGAWLLMAGIVYTLLSAVAHRSGRPWHDRLAGTHFESRIGRAAETRVLPWYRQSVWWIAIGTIGLTYWVGWQIAEIDLKEIVQGLTSVGPLASALVQPEFSILEDCAWAMVETVYLALMATTFAVPVAVVLSFLGARNIMPRTVIGTSVYFVMRTIFTVVRSIEPIVWAIIFVVWVGLSPFAGMLALMVHSIAALGKLYSEQVENIDQGPVEAIRATGAGAVHTVVYAVWPQVVPPFVAFTLYRWDINVRMATIVGMVGGGGIGALLLQYQGMARWNEVALIAWMITMVVWLMDISSARIRERMI